MKIDKEKLENKSAKQLRTLRNQLNNRISSFESGKESKLKASHALFGLDHDDCKELTILVKRRIKALNHLP